MVVSPETSDLDPQIVDAELRAGLRSSTAIVTIERQQEALKLVRSTTTTIVTHTYKGPVEVPLAVLRMLARYFDLPFRKDVLKRIIEDQLNRTDNGGEEATLGLLQLAATADLVGLRATQLKIKENQIGRLQFPAIVLSESGAVVAWNAEPTGNVLIGDPVKGQVTIRVTELKGRDEENLIEVLTVQRSKNSPKKRFGLSWFLPALKQHKMVLVQVLVASFFVQLFGLLNPLLIQQIIDAVISQGNVSSLNVLGLLVGMSLA